MRILNTQPLRRQIILATCVVLVLFTLAAIWSAARTWEERQAEVEEQAASIAATSAAFLSQYLDGLDGLATVLARHPAVVELDRDRADPLFADLLRGYSLLLNIVLTDPEGLLRASAVPGLPSLAPVATRESVQDVMRTGRQVVSQMTKGAFTGKLTVVLAYPVRNPAGAPVAVLGLGLNLAELQSLFRGIPLPEGSVITLTDAKSRVLARSRDADQFIGTTIQVRPLAPRDAPTRQTAIGVDGVPRFFGNAPIDRGPWLLSVGIPTSVAFARVAPLFARNVTIVVASIVSVLLAALVMSTWISRGLGRIRDAVQRIADGDLSPPTKVSLPTLELGQLQDAFITMAANLRAAHDALDHQIDQERKMRETLQSLQHQVVRQERLAAVGVLVSGVAHELNNPLQAILGTAELLERRPELSADALEDVSFVKTQSGRAREIIRNLSRFSSQHTGPPALVDLRDVITEVVQLRRGDLDAASIALDVETSTARLVYASFTELEQVTLNFVINAQQSIQAAGHDNGRIMLRLFDTGKKVRLEMQDDGPGVSADDEPKLFQPFFTTKPVGQGTGLGLSVSYGIIDSYGGEIGYRGNEWGGATFFFELPVADRAGLSDSHDRSPVLHERLPSNV